jgi:L,D-transpeptidase ErfK/SrfK
MIFTSHRFIACLFAAFSLSAFAGELPSLSNSVAGGDTVYNIQPDDMLSAISARFAVETRVLAQQNAISNPDLIYAGRSLHIHNLHIVPAGFDDGIVINIPQRMLFNFSQGQLVAAYPVGLGKPTWPTPEGQFQVYMKEMNKAWKVPKSIQEEMRREAKVVQEEVPPGPDNPLGKYWLGLTLWGYGIHGTIAPSSVYHFQSHGCIRLQPDDIASLYDLVKKGTHGRLVYQPVQLAVVDGGRILLEVNPDIYEKGTNPAQTVRDMAEANGLSHDINWPLVEAVIASQEGLAREVGRLPSIGFKGKQP